MKQILQNLSNGETVLADVPVPGCVVVTIEKLAPVYRHCRMHRMVDAMWRERGG